MFFGQMVFNLPPLVGGYFLGTHEVGLYSAALDVRIKSVASFSGFTPMRTNTADKPTGGLDVSYHESDVAHQIYPGHLPAAIDWLKAAIA